MKNIFSKLVLVALLFSSMTGTAYADVCHACKTNSVKKNVVKSKAAVCKRAQSTAELNVNNVRALINGYGNMWYDGSLARYHVPKDGTSTALFCAALWIGGTDVNDQLRIAALRFGSEGDDYWPGPLTIDGTADVTLETCNEYDRHFKISQAEVQRFMSMFDYTDQGGVMKEGFSSSDIPQSIREWPAHGDKSKNQSYYLAPFKDLNGNGTYEPEIGEYPYYDFNNDLCPKTLKAALAPGEKYVPTPTMEDSAGIVTGGLLSDQVLKGDQTIWWVFNDMGNTHTESNGEAIGMEIRAQAFAFSTNDEINNMTFYSYEIINRSSYELRNTYFSQWVDPDLGYAQDDFIGCDVKRGLGYCYNGDEQDGPGTGKYSGIPPAVGIDFFQGPYMDPDGMDNPKIDIDKMRLYYPEALTKYWLADRNCYDTISLTDDADLFIQAWYFKQNDSVGNCAINGVNFGNNIIDDERFGMRRFVYYENSLSNINGEPTKATDYYNYLQGFWKNGSHMKFGGNAISSGTTDLYCDFMFPGDSDPWNWGTNGVDPEVDYSWTEVTAGENVSPGDRRFMQSAGPFTLKPGALNYITVGIPFAQATSGSAWSSVELLRQVDDVCQALFENCFKVLDGPDAPTMIAQEMNNEVILYLTYENTASNNYNEKYSEINPSIVRSYTNEQGETATYTDEERSYKFEGYQIYQLKDANASISDIGDETKARLVAQCDIENYYDADNTIPIGTLVNYTSNSATGILSGNVMVNGSNKGIQHVFRITNDAFASGVSTNLVNNKEYYFIAVAYAHNRYKEYSQTDASKLDGQKEPYLAGRKSEKGGAIEAVTVIPHDPSIENGGTVVQAEYGLSPNITRIEGLGNGGRALELTQESIEQLMGAPGQNGMGPGMFKESVTGGAYNLSATYMQNPCIIANPRYEQNAGPINVKVIDPLNLKAGQFYIQFDGISDTSKWVISKVDGTPLYDSVYTDTADFVIGRYNEQLFLDLGIAVSIANPTAVATDLVVYTNANGRVKTREGLVNEGGLISSSLDFADETKQWLSGVPDNDSYMMYNWIRSGSQYAVGDVINFTGKTNEYSMSEAYLDDDYYKSVLDDNTLRVSDFATDKYQVFENVVGGLWAPYGLCSSLDYHPAFNFSYYVADQAILDSLHNSSSMNAKTYNTYWGTIRNMFDHTSNKSLMYNDFSKLPSVYIVLTSDKSKWTRCPVIEMCDDYTQSEGNARRFQSRKHLSVDKDGNTIEDLGISANSSDPDNPAYIAAEGMGWFPGYAISLETGERLNIMFGEDSRYVQYNGRDMKWNPVSTIADGTQNYVLGGRHYIYVMNSMTQDFPRYHAATTVTSIASYKTPSYDAGRWAHNMLGSLDRIFKQPASKDFNRGLLRDEGAASILPVRDSAAFFYSTVAWVSMPVLNPRYTLDDPANIPTDVTITINVNRPYRQYLSTNQTTPTHCGIDTNTYNYNHNNPMYMFELTNDIVTLTGQATAANAAQSYKDSILNMINVVPNPYYSASAYETQSQLETKVRFTNIPVGSVISIYTVDGTLVRRLGPTSASAHTNVDWDLHNHNGIPIAGGVYLVHVQCPGIGERVIKWFGTMRPVPLDDIKF